MNGLLVYPNKTEKNSREDSGNSAVFPFIIRGRVKEMDMVFLQIFNGLSLGSVLLLIAIGLAITFGLMKVINMAHGELIMIGAYTAFLMQNIFKGLPESWFDFYFILAIPMGFLVAAAFGLLIELSLIRFLYKRPLDSLLATWGVGLILQQFARTIFGAPNVGVSRPSFLKGGVLAFGGLYLPYSRIFIILLSLSCLLALYLYLYKSHNGRKIRAVMQNREMAACLGISVRKIDRLTFAIGSGLAGIAGVVLTLIGPIGPSIGVNYIIDAFIVVVVGGAGTLIGTLAGAFGIGLANTLLEFWTTTSMGKVLVFILVIAFLQWRPSGILAVKSRALD